MKLTRFVLTSRPMTFCQRLNHVYCHVIKHVNREIQECACMKL
jgi:hypothetical protein